MENNESPNVRFDPYPGNPAICVASDDDRYIGTAVGSEYIYIMDTTDGSTLCKTPDRVGAGSFIQKLVDIQLDRMGRDR